MELYVQYRHTDAISGIFSLRNCFGTHIVIFLRLFSLEFCLIHLCRYYHYIPEYQCHHMNALSFKNSIKISAPLYSFIRITSQYSLSLSRSSHHFIERAIFFSPSRSPICRITPWTQQHWHMIMSPSLLTLATTATNGEFDLDLGPETLNSLRLEPRSYLEPDRPIGFAVWTRKRRKKCRYSC